jgi:hypothetical protein
LAHVLTEFMNKVMSNSSHWDFLMSPNTHLFQNFKINVKNLYTKI